MGWFPTGRAGPSGWHFDIVGLLAVIGESTIGNHAQVITASSLSRFPRLIPAPQTLLKTTRPARLPSTKGVVVMGVYSGTRLEELNYFANVIHDIGSLKDYEFRVYDIEHCDAARGSSGGDAAPDDEERGTTPAISDEQRKEVVKIPVYTFCALNILTICSILLTVGLLVWAILIQDGVACIALASVSISASLACLASQWRPELSQRPTGAAVPPGDVVIKTRGAAFVVVHCTEEITRELYAGTEKCHYEVGEDWYKILVATSTILLMVAVVLLGNCEWTMQAAIGVSYMILNGLYWAIPLIATTNWDMRRYKVTQRPTTIEEGSGANVNFTETLWYAIRETKEVGWVEDGDLAPRSPAWREWLKEAKANCNDPHWPAVKVKDELMKKAKERLEQERHGGGQAGASLGSSNLGQMGRNLHVP